MKAFSIWVGSFLILAGCSHAPVVGSWVGKPIDSAVVAWGPPTATQTLSDGRRVVSWEGPNGACRAWFTVDRGGVIADSKVEGAIGPCNLLMRGKKGPA